MRKRTKIFVIGSVIQLLLLSITLIAIYRFQSSVIQNITGDWVWAYEKSMFVDNYDDDMLKCVVIIDEFEEDKFLSFTDTIVAQNWGKFTPYRVKRNIIYPSRFIYTKVDSVRFANEWIVVNKWEATSFSMIGKDTLVVDNIYDRQYYSRLLPKTQVRFDSILFVSDRWDYGTNPVMSMMIHSDGRVFFHGEDFTEKQGFYSGILSEKQSKSILNKLQQIDLDSVTTEYGNAMFNTDFYAVMIYSKGEKRHAVLYPENYEQFLELGIFLHYLIELYKWVDLKEVPPFEFKEREEIFYIIPPLIPK